MIRRIVPLAIILSAAITAGAQTNLVPFFDDPTYGRTEPVDPPWFVHNDGQPSKLYHSGVYQSSETGTNDLNLWRAWEVQSAGAKVGVVDISSHGQRVKALVSTVSPWCTVYYHEVSRTYSDVVADAIMDCLSNQCRVIVITTGYSTGDALLSNACVSASLSNAVIVCSVPNTDGNLDGAMVDYPYAWRFGNVLGATSTDRNGNHYSPSGTGTNAVGAPGRNIVAAGTYSSGTSYAAPILAGCVSLLAGRFPCQSAEAYATAIKISAEPVSRRVNIVRAFDAVRPVVTLVDGCPVVYGLPGWNYVTQWSSDLVTWQDGEPSALLDGGCFYRAMVP